MIRYAITEGLRPDVYRPQVEFVQLRAKDVEAGELARRARSLLKAIDGTGPRLLVNGRVDVAVAVGAAGVHLTTAADELTAAQVRAVFAAAGCASPVISRSCHTLEDVRRAAEEAVDLILFGPVFEKRVAGEVVVAGVGLDLLREACAAANGVAVLALGGVTDGRVAACLEAGAKGVAGIRMFG